VECSQVELASDLQRPYSFSRDLNILIYNPPFLKKWNPLLHLLPTMFVLSAVLSTLASSTLASPTVFSVESHNLFKRITSGCPDGGPTSCHNTSSVANSCCFESPGVSYDSIRTLPCVETVTMSGSSIADSGTFLGSHILIHSDSLDSRIVLGHQPFHWSYRQLDGSW
jgi:hypothetical protein